MGGGGGGQRRQPLQQAQGRRSDVGCIHGCGMEDVGWGGGSSRGEDAVLGARPVGSKPNDKLDGMVTNALVSSWTAW